MFESITKRNNISTNSANRILDGISKDKYNLYQGIIKSIAKRDF